MTGSMALRFLRSVRSLVLVTLFLAEAVAPQTLLAQQPPVSDVLPAAPREPQASLSRNDVPAQGESDVLLNVQMPGRVRVRADSTTGVALQFVDMMAGPGTLNGEAGVRDGAVDELADKGTYKIRSFGAEGGKGDAKLILLPYRNAAPASAALLRGGTFSGELADLQQRSFWVIVGPDGQVDIDAGGRALHDVVLWRNGTDRVTLRLSASEIEPKSGHALSLLRLTGRVEPGLYLVTAYGGSALPWVDDAKEQPFHIRIGGPDVMAGTVMDGTIGPLGFVRLSVPAPANYLRLETPDPAPVRLSAQRDGSVRTADIKKNSRNPIAAVTLANRGNEPAVVTITGQEGQSFRLRTLASTERRFAGQGPYLVGADFAGAGGEEAPAMAVFVDIDEKGSGRVLHSEAPRIGGGTAWRGKFNLRGPTALIFQVTAPGPLTVSAEGPNARYVLAALMAKAVPDNKSDKPVWNVEPGWYWLSINPINDAGGVLDLTIGPPDAKPDAPATLPVNQATEFGRFPFERHHNYMVFFSSAPGQVMAPLIRPLPLNLGDGAVTVRQATSVENWRLPISTPIDGDITVSTVDGKPVTVKRLDVTTEERETASTLEIPATSSDRFLTIVWKKPAAPLVVPTVEQRELPALDAGKARFFDLNRNQNRSFRLDVATGGLYRVETTGRLKTGLTIGTAFLPKIADAQDNGTGHNALLQNYLRAGSYRVNVSVRDSDGHLGLTATPAPLQNAGTLVPEGSIRTTLASGSGAIFNIDIPKTGPYTLALYGLDRSFSARLEDADGWPLTVPAEFDKEERRFTAGKYRLVVQPQAVDARVVARLQASDEPAELKGHGPHPAIFTETRKYQTTRSFQWREPENKNAPRDPDIWTFSLAGSAKTRIEISDGMAADLVRQGSDRQRVGRVTSDHVFAGDLPAGNYVLEARAIGRNDRLDYELTIDTDEIQPGLARWVDVPSVVPFSIAQDRVVNLATFGGIALKGVLKDASGKEIERMTGRDHDWNITLSRYLPAGSYRLELDNAKVAASARRSSDDSGDDSDEESNDGEKPATEINFSLPDAAEPAALAFTGQAMVTDARVHSYTLPQAEPGNLVLLTAQSAGEIALSLEKRDADGRWQAQGFARGAQPLLAMPTDSDKTTQWRISVWRVDGGIAPISVAARSINQTMQTVGAVKLAPFTIDGFNRPVHIAAVSVPGAGLVQLKGRVTDLLQGSASAKLLRATETGVLAVQSDRLWLVTRDTETIAFENVLPQNGEIALELGDGEHAVIAPAPVPQNKIRVWRADSTFGQPTFLPDGISPSQPGVLHAIRPAIAPGSALILAGEQPLQVKNGSKGQHSTR